MANQNNKNSSLALFLICAFAAIIVIMLIVHHRSRVANEIHLPLNNGIANLATCNNLLAAVSNDNKIYVWDWASVSKKPREGAVESEQAALVAFDTVVSVKRENPAYVVASGLDANKNRREIPLPPGSGTAYLGVNRDGSKIVLLLARCIDEGCDRAKYDLFDVSIDTGHVQPIVTIDSEQSKPGHLSVSDDGNRIVVAGEKNSHGWMFLVNAREKRLEWQKEMGDFKKIFKAVFSCDGATIYARGSDSMLLLIKASSGEIIDRLSATEENKSTYKEQAVQMVVVSGDGNFVAATVVSTIYVWDTKTKKKLYELSAREHKVLSSITFSGDSRFIASSDMRQGGIISIMQIPQAHN